MYKAPNKYVPSPALPGTFPDPICDLTVTRTSQLHSVTMTNQIVMTDEQFQSLISGMTLALSNTNRTSNFDGNFSKCAS
ncbi:hypothetical protein NQ318_010287 [Aromia moschata]|uniref:Uncharacterized protein n=1 Tax=Aromia moschata TaxID=1265417 RepID=A0AAV8X8X3_9CUCU|nr:hypothetical protein NQ318_010287 [Aromia moschata]